MADSDPDTSSSPQTVKLKPAPLKPSIVIRTALLIGLIVVLGLLAWKLAHVLLLVFASVLVAIILVTAAGLVERFTPIKSPWSLALAGFVIAALIGGFAFLMGAQVQAEISELSERFPELVETIGEEIGVDDLGERMENWAETAAGNGLVQTIAGYTSGILDAMATLLIVITAGVFMAINPRTYRRGLLTLIPKSQRDTAGRTVEHAGRALRLWLMGQLVSMVFVGVATTIGLMLIGAPSPLALGLLAGVLEFIPMVGPVLASIPAILLALAEGGTMVFWVVGLYVIIQQTEGNVIMPLIQKRAVHLPPVLMLFSILAFGVLFGPLGVVLATPLAVLFYVAVKQIYVRETLGEETDVPGEEE